MGILGIGGKVAAAPFKFLFGRMRKKDDSADAVSQNAESQYMPQPAVMNQQMGQVPSMDAPADNIKAKVDLMLSQIDSLKIEYEAINQRIQNIERMVRELYSMSKS